MDQNGFNTRYVLGLEERPRRTRGAERLAPVSQNVITILLAELAKVVGEQTSNMVQAMLLYGEDYVVAHTMETNEGVVRQALASYHTFTEAPGGPTHDHADCPHRGWTARVPDGARAQP